MITKLTIRNFKNIIEQSYEFTDFDLLVGSNNSGKSTILQAMAIWQFCVQVFRQTTRTGSAAMTITLDNFTALPVSEFNLLWNRRRDREVPKDQSGRNLPQRSILIEIEIEWNDPRGANRTFGVELRYDKPSSIYARPTGGWGAFRAIDAELPTIAFVPPFSGLEPVEEWRTDPVIRRQIGKAQPGSVLRNLLVRVLQSDKENGTEDWEEIHRCIKQWFSIDMDKPEYDEETDVHVKSEYRDEGRRYDIISGGSGFHQTLVLLAFLYGYKPNTILLDEPDAHLHVNLQREIIDYFKRKSAETNIQFIIATHAEELVKGVDVKHIISLLKRQPTRVSSATDVLTAMADVSNIEVTQLKNSSTPVIIYIEEENDERMLRAWSKSCGAEDIVISVVHKTMGGGDKRRMKDEADRHFAGIREIVPNAGRVMLFDRDEESSYHPDESNSAMYEWGRRNIENYMFVPNSWIRFVQSEKDRSVVNEELEQVVSDFFASQNLTLPPNQTWLHVSADIFKVLDGKRLLFENENSLFHRLQRVDSAIYATRDRLALAMLPEEIHEDVHSFFAKLRRVVDKVRADVSAQFTNHEEAENGNGSDNGNAQVSAPNRRITPAAVTIEGQRYEAKTWREVARRLVEFVMDNYPERFTTAAVRFPRWLSKYEEQFREAYPLKNGWYMEVNLDRGQIRGYYERFLAAADIPSSDWSVKEQSLLATLQR